MNNNINLIKKDNKIVVSSREVAENFDKRHTEVLRAIEDKISQNAILRSDKYFIEQSYKAGTGKNYKEYLMTRDGFSFLVMGFTGQKADEFKIAYIEAFNKMENTIRNIDKNALQVKSIENKTKNAEARLNNSKARIANIWLKLAEKTDIPEYKQVIVSNVSAVLSGKQLLPLPNAEKKTYTANEIGDRLGISGNMVGRITNANGLKTEKYGKLFYDKSKYSNKEVETFRYYDNVVPELEKILNKI